MLVRLERAINGFLSQINIPVSGADGSSSNKYIYHSLIIAIPFKMFKFYFVIFLEPQRSKFTTFQKFFFLHSL